jgi:hypothetical protein
MIQADSGSAATELCRCGVEIPKGKSYCQACHEARGGMSWAAGITVLLWFIFFVWATREFTYFGSK